MTATIKEQIKEQTTFKKPKQAKKIKPKVKIFKIIKTRGNHSWVETDKGIFRKENKNIPQELFKK
jgi:hypothetical protein